MSCKLVPLLTDGAARVNDPQMRMTVTNAHPFLQFLDLPQWRCNSLQQVDLVDSQIQYVPPFVLPGLTQVLEEERLPSNRCSPPRAEYPILLTAWHLTFSTIMTQVLARTTTLLDGRKKIKMTGRVYLRAIVPIGFAFSLSLMCGNMTYLYLSVSFIQMLKVRAPLISALP